MMAGRGKKKKLYDDQQVINAIASVKNGLSFRAAAAKYGVPVQTVRDRYYGKYKEGKHTPGPSLSLSYEQEECLKQHLLRMVKIGYGMYKKEVPLLIKEILDKAEKDDPVNYNPQNRRFKDNMPSITWIYKFLARHPNLTPRTQENLGHQRSYVNEQQIRKWFADMAEFLKNEHGIDVQSFLSSENSARIFNLDESGFPLAGTNGRLKVIAAKGVKNVYRLAPDTREQITVLGCVSAAGTFSKPLVIYPGVRPKFNLQDVDPQDYDLGCSANGWISADCFFEWLSNLFFPSIVGKVQFPVIIFMDGHASHINLAVSTFCREKDIILYCFPAHASHVLQPLDVSVYGPLKKEWNSSLTTFAKEYKGLAMSRAHFLKVFDKAWKKVTSNPQIAVSGFRKCGLMPFNPNAIPYDRLIEKTDSVSNSSASNELSTLERVGIT